MYAVTYCMGEVLWVSGRTPNYHRALCVESATVPQVGNLIPAGLNPSSDARMRVQTNYFIGTGPCGRANVNDFAAPFIACSNTPTGVHFLSQTSGCRFRSTEFLDDQGSSSGARVSATRANPLPDIDKGSLRLLLYLALYHLIRSIPLM